MHCNQLYRKFFFIFLFMQAGSLASHAGHKTEIDSLRKVIAGSGHDTVKINAHIKLGDLLNDEDSVKAHNHFIHALALARSQKNKEYVLRTYFRVGKRYLYTPAYRYGVKFLKEGILYSRKYKNPHWQKELYLCMADLYQYQNLAKQSIPWFDSVLLHAKNMPPADKADILMHKGRAYYDIGEYKPAMDYYVKAQKIFEGNNIYDRNYGHLLHFIGSVFKRQESYEKALTYYEKELELGHKLNDPRIEAEGLYLAGAMYGTLGNLDKELEYELRALEIYRKEKNERSIALMLGNLSSNYSDRGDLKTAIKFLEEALVIYERNADEEKKAWVYRTLGDNYSKTGQHTKAVAFYKKSIEANNKTETKHLLTAADIKQSMAWAYARSGDHKSAFETYLEYEKLRDSISNENNRQYLHDQEAKYDTEKKQRQIDKQNAELAVKSAEAKEKDAQQNLLIIGCILVLIIAGISGWAFFTKRKANKVLAAQFDEIAHKNIIIREKNKDITDSINYAKRIQEAVLPLPEDLNSFFSESFVFYRPKDIVSGDFYWFSQLDDTAVLAVGDCTGHGVPGAFMSIIGHDLLNQVVLEDKIRNPSDILHILDKRVTNTLNKRGSRQEYHDGMDIAVCTFDKKERKMTFAGANRPLVIKRGEQIVELPPNKFAIGGSQDSRAKIFNQHEVKLDESDIVYMFSDGYHDQFGGASGKKLKYHQLKEYIGKLAKNKLADHQGVFAAHFDAWKGDIEQVDDVCVIGVRI